MSDLVNLGFKADTGGLTRAQMELDKTTVAGGRLDKAALSLGKSMAAVAAGMLAVTSAGAVTDTIFKFDEALKGLQATSRASTKDMAALEAQARSLGATSRFSATQAADAQRFLAMAGFEVNQILKATPSILKLATAANVDLASAADMASNALGGLQLPVSELDRVIDVMAETAATANTSVTQLAGAFENSAPIATAAGVKIEELSAIIGSLSDSGIQAEKAGTGVGGMLRQISNLTPAATEVLKGYGITVQDMSIEANGLTGVLKTLGAASLSVGDAITIFGSEAANAALVAANNAEKIELMTKKYQGAAGAAKEMSDIMSGSLTAGALGLGSAMSELALKVGDAGLTDAIKEAMLATTGFAHVFTGMLPEFAAANNLTTEYTESLTMFADVTTVTAGALGGLVGAMLITKVAAIGLSGVMATLNAIMFANPIVLVVGSLAALTGGLYAARNMTVEFGDETIKVIDAINGGFNTLKDGFDFVADAALGAYDYLSDIFSGIAVNANGSANSVSDDFISSFENIYEGAKTAINKTIGTFIALGKTIGIVAAATVSGFTNAFDNVQMIGEGFWKDFTGIFEGKVGLDNMSSAVKNALIDPMKDALSAINEEAGKALNADYIGDAGKKISEAVDGIVLKFEAYTLGARDARIEGEKLRAEAELFSSFSETMSAPSWISEPISKTVSVDGGGVSEISNELSELISQVDEFGGAWTRTGNVIAEAFGGAVDVLNDYSKRMQGISDLQGELTSKRADYADGTKEAIEIDGALAKLQAESTSAQIGALGKTIGLSASLFEENSKERKALHALEMGFMAAEMALAAEKAIVTAVGAVANQGNGDPYTAFGRIAAMIGIMAGVLGAAGIAFGGGGGSSYSAPAPGGTGSVLGDSEAQSESVVNAFEMLEDIEVDQLAELQGIRKSMTALSNGIDQLAKSFVSNLDFTNSGYDGTLGTIKSSADSPAMDLVEQAHKSLGGGWLYDMIGDPILDAVIGGFSSTKKELVDSGIRFVSQTYADIFESGQVDASVFQVIEKTKKKFWGLSKSSSTSTELTGVDSEIATQIANVFGYIGDTVIEASNSLLGDKFTEQLLQSYQIDIGDISFKDKTGEEIQAELEAIFSQQADLMTNFVFPQLREYQGIGEGLFETLIRVNQEQAIFNDAMERTGYEYSKFTTELEKVGFAQSIISLTGGLEAFTELSNSFFESFYSDAEQFAYLEQSLGEAFDGLGLSMVDSREGFKDLINGVDITTEAGQQLYAMLLQLVPGMDEYLSALEDEQSAKDAAAAKLAEQAQSLDIQLLEAMGLSSEALAMSRQIELEAADESLRAIMLRIWALEDEAAAELKATQEAQAIADARSALYIQLLNAQGKSEEALMLTRQQQLDSLDPSLHALQMQVWAEQELTAAREESEASLNQSISDIESRRSALDSAASGFRNISDAIGDLIFDTYAALDSGSVSLTDAVDAARGGDFSVYERTNSDNEIGNASDYQNINDYIFARDVAFNKLAEIRSLSLSAEDVTEKAIETIDTNISQLTVDMFAQNESLESINSSNANIDNGVLELVNTMRSEKESAEMAAVELKVLLENLNRESVAANKTLKRIEQNTYEVIE